MIVKASQTFPATYKALTQAVRVLHVINGEHYSGAERVQDLLALQLPNFGYEVGFVCLKQGLFEKNRRCLASAIYNVDMNSKFDLAAYKKVVRIFREGNYSLLHAHTPRSLMVAAMASRSLRCPLVYHVHSPVGRDSKRWLANKINTWAENLFLSRVDKMICVSSSLRKYMKSLGHRPENLTVVPNGVPVINSPDIAPPKGEFILGMVALFRPRKGTEVLLEALAELKSRGERVRLIAVGPFENAEYGEEIHRLAKRLAIEDMIEWTGFEKDVQSRLQTMHAMVLPSLFGEGLPMVVLEAMASGLPVIASRVEGIPEAIRDGIDGALFEPGDAKGLADQVQRLLADIDRWREMGVSARQRHRECLSDTAMASKVATVYRDILN